MRAIQFSIGPKLDGPDKPGHDNRANMACSRKEKRPAEAGLSNSIYRFG
jgi:hypothetical protein